MDGARPLRSTRRLQNLTTMLPRWYNIAAPADGSPTLVSIYDEIGFYGVSAGAFMADVDAITGDIEMHINSPGGDIYEGLTIYNRLKQRKGNIHVIVDGLAASAASFLAMAASPGQLEMAPRSEMMIHNGFMMAIGDAADLRKSADLLDRKTADIADMYAERSGKPAAYWLAKMNDETWLSAEQAVAEGLADRIQGQPSDPSAQWDMSVFAKFPAPVPVNSAGQAAPIHDAMTGTHSHPDPAYGDELAHEHTHDGDAVHDRSQIDPDGDGDDDTTAAGDTDHDYVEPDGSPGPKAEDTRSLSAALADMWPVLAGAVDESPWDAGKAWAAGAASDDPAAFYRGICAGRKAGDPDTQDAWALPYRYTPKGAPNAAGVRAALARLSQTKDLTNSDEARATLEKAMRVVNPDYDPDALATPATLASLFTSPVTPADDSAWNPQAALALAASSSDPAAFYAAICAARKAGDPATPDAWALPYRYTPGSPPNATGVREALAALPVTGGLANPDEARTVLDRAMKTIDPAHEPDDHIDPALLSAVFASALKGAGSK